MTIPGVIIPSDCSGVLTIDSVVLNTPAWACVDLFDLWLSPNIRGTNVVIPGAVGRRPYATRVDETHYSLPMIVTGICDEMASPWYDNGYSSPYEQLEANLTTIAGLLVQSTQPTVSASLDMPSGATLTAEVQVVGIRSGAHEGPVLRVTLEIIVPAGRFA